MKRLLLCLLRLIVRESSLQGAKAVIIISGLLYYFKFDDKALLLLLLVVIFRLPSDNCTQLIQPTRTYVILLFVSFAIRPLARINISPITPSQCCWHPLPPALGAPRDA